MDEGTLRGLATLVALLAFIGVIWWAWSGRQSRKFEDAARMPLEEDQDRNEGK